VYQSYPTLVLGFHGCDNAIGEALVNGTGSFKASKNKYDWLGSGMYFWEHSEHRAKHWAEHKQIKTPCVVGAVIDLGFCLNLIDYFHIKILEEAYYTLTSDLAAAGKTIPQNNPVFPGDSDKLKRNLDCAVINYLHSLRKESEVEPFDTVRGVFFEGQELYPNAGFKQKNHIQIAVRNPNCIKGFFWPRELDPKFRRP
jgi:hypothetical protein